MLCSIVICYMVDIERPAAINSASEHQYVVDVLPTLEYLSVHVRQYVAEACANMLSSSLVSLVLLYLLLLCFTPG